MATAGQHESARAVTSDTLSGCGEAARAAVIYDGECLVCSHLARVAASLDRDHRLELIASGDEEVASRFPSLTREACDAALQLVTPGGETRQGAAAVASVLGMLPGLAWLGRLLRLPGLRGLAVLAYGVLARHRHGLAAHPACPSEDAALARRRELLALTAPWHRHDG